MQNLGSKFVDKSPDAHELQYILQEVEQAETELSEASVAKQKKLQDNYDLQVCTTTTIKCYMLPFPFLFWLYFCFIIIIQLIIRISKRKLIFVWDLFILSSL